MFTGRANAHVTFSGQFMQMLQAFQGNLQRNKINKVIVQLIRYPKIENNSTDTLNLTRGD